MVKLLRSNIFPWKNSNLLNLEMGPFRVYGGIRTLDWLIRFWEYFLIGPCVEVIDLIGETASGHNPPPLGQM